MATHALFGSSASLGLRYFPLAVVEEELIYCTYCEGPISNILIIKMIFKGQIGPFCSHCALRIATPDMKRTLLRSWQITLTKIQLHYLAEGCSENNILLEVSKTKFLIAYFIYLKEVKTQIPVYSNGAKVEPSSCQLLQKRNRKHPEALQTGMGCVWHTVSD